MAIVREVTIGNCRLIQGDCLEIMPTLGRVDAVVTDPPWNMDYFENDNKPWSEYADWLEALNAQYISVSTGPILIFLSSKAIPYVSHKFDGWQPFVAVKNFSQMSKSTDTIPNAFDIGFALMRGKYSGVGRNWWSCNTAGMVSQRTGHPTPRTLDCMETAINLCDAQTILDPFMGSGTTGVACVNLGRSFIGIELDPDYFDIAVKRITDAHRQADLFIDKPAPVKMTQEAFL
jgi:site-specific DNA-methyltransferase (adenine-specific)/modification methylase